MTDTSPMTSHRPYLLRALYEWIADNGMTPHLLVDATREGVRVPAHTVNEGKVVLNIAARAVLAIYARETGQGMALPDENAGHAGSQPAPVETPDDDDTPPPDGGSEPPKRGGHLRIVK